MALLYQNHLRDLFKYADTCDPQVKCLVAAHSPFDSAINPMVFPHAGVAELPEVDGYIAQVWSDTARSEMTDPTRDGEDVEAVFQKAFLEYNYFQNLLRGTKKELIVLQDPKSDSEGFPWQTYRRWYEQTVVALSLLNVASFEVMPWPDRFFVQEASQEQQTSFLAVIQGMRDLRNYPSYLGTSYAMLVVGCHVVGERRLRGGHHRAYGHWRHDASGWGADRCATPGTGRRGQFPRALSCNF